ncbi:HNH endonuclease [Lacrimispora sp.]|uniref:HNH endonuclease n=1 Tax=Lacrimispora sp. TaxID=2719234 RepID=UPI0028AA97EA|nr:HNH endonuclease [Lacrimispora sp.]
MLERKELYSIDEIKKITKDVLFERDKKNAKIILDGDVINGNSQRYQTFLSKGCSCVKCGIEGKYFAKERTKDSRDSFHLNLYAVDKNGNEVLMTKDHIVPKSRGGKNYIDNYQTMCTICNYEKGNQEIN